MAIKPVVGYTGSGWNYPGMPKPAAAKAKAVNPATYNPMAYVPGGSSPAVATAIQNKGMLGLPKLKVPQSSSIVSPLAQTSVDTSAQTNAANQAVSDAAAQGAPYTGLDEYMNEVQSDPNYAIGQKNYQDALSMGERSLLSDPISKLLSTYGYDPRSYLAQHPDASIPQSALDLANKYLDPTAAAAAAKDPSTVANQISYGYNQSLAGIPTNLATQGLQNSGSSAIQANKLARDRAIQDSQAMQQFLGGLGTANQNWTDYQTNQANIWRGAQEDIATRLAQVAGYHASTDAAVRAAQIAADAARASQAGGGGGGDNTDYSGGADAVYQPASDVGALMQQGQQSGEWDSWANAMANVTQAANKPTVYQPSPATQKVIKKMKSSGESSAWAKAMAKLGSAR